MKDDQPHESLVHAAPDPLIRILNRLVVWSVKILAVLMVIVIWLALIDVVIHLIQHVSSQSVRVFNVENIIATLGDFLAVLICIEIFMNIVFYLKEDAIHVPLVLATALTAIARKVIILDYRVSEPFNLLGIAAIIISVGLSYWLITKKNVS